MGRKRMKQCWLVTWPQGQDMGSSHLNRLSTEPMLPTIPTPTFRVPIYWEFLSNLTPLLQTKLLFSFSTNGLHQRNVSTHCLFSSCRSAFFLLSLSSSICASNTWTIWRKPHGSYSHLSASWFLAVHLAERITQYEW